jgi:hypothetical protein
VEDEEEEKVGVVVEEEVEVVEVLHRHFHVPILHLYSNVEAYVA